ncbi:ABC transporter ATP-binding protein [Lachnobacterium bovis]|jgi:ABC-2 type transport system ATP-binding protein|uniref:ABC-2 type transport system ATP-binding protein n=1 Tax=Lachnobacterium bovis DSM 14045 TaxID=1122142 RepID=A0A1H3J482_9FIRM|nr:ABC transporter ATP-binding protein [Lachnobacterium bovis]MBQ1802839.1 ABC transporter ATP-binding protein [Lachnobacterium sp.]SDY34761.1 ABC-2 type transport system ATP-binding protein [Lachnobacterium bovis DSM 14045]
MSNVIEINNLVKRYKELVALDHFNLTVDEGEILGLLGPNGSGKTTTINCILALLTYDKGSIKVFGKEMKATSYDIKKDIGVVMQDVAVFDDLTVYENVDYFCGLYIKDKKIRKQYVEEALNFVELTDFYKFKPKKLSGGLLRRLNIACGIAHKPKLIFFDEPTVAVDPQSRNKILDGIKELNRKGATIIYTSHYMEEIEQLCSRIVIMDKGKSIAMGTKDELKAMIHKTEKITIEVADLASDFSSEFAKLPNFSSYSYNDNVLNLTFKGGRNNLAHVMNILSKHPGNLGRISSETPTLNDVFLEITGTELRDNV